MAAVALAGQSGGTAKAKAWAGSITYEATGHMVLHEGREIFDFRYTVSVEGTISAQDSTEFRRANGKATWFERHTYPATCPGKITRVDTESGSTSGVVRLNLHLQEKAGAPYDISVAAPDVPVKGKGGCPDGFGEFTSERSVGLLTMSGKVKKVGEGLVLSGKKASPPTMGPHGCDVSFVVECRVTETLAWNLGTARTKLQITELELFDRDPFWNKGKTKGKEFTKLEYLSASPHPYYKFGGEGQTRIYGTIAIEGPAGDELDRIWLEVLENGARAAIAPQAPDVLFTPSRQFRNDDIVEAFDERIVIEKPDFLFRLPASEAEKINQKRDSKLTLRVHARTSSGEEATRDFGPVTKLVLYEGENRYRDRDPAYGGDGWARPSTLDAIRHFSKTNPDLLLGDMSNMNGGRFWPHSSHGDGRNVDAWVKGYSKPACFDANAEYGYPEEEICLNEVTELAATKLVGLLNDATYGSKIEKIFVTYQTEWASRRQFYDAIGDITLADGRKAVDVIGLWQEHDTHFHLRFKQ